MRLLTFFLLNCLVLLNVPRFANAHAFGQSYVLPLPVWLYLYGGSAVVAVSFAIVGWFVTNHDHDAAYPTVALPWKVSSDDWYIIFIQFLTVALFIMAIIAGIVGIQAPTENIAPLLFWIILLLGMTYVSAIFGNVWPTINPARIIATAAVRLFDRRTTTPYPEKLGYWPAVLTYIFIIWLELLSRGFAVVPLNLAKLLLFYIIITIGASLLFGVRTWFTYGDFFSVFFRLFGAIAPFERGDDGRLTLRAPFIGLSRITVHQTSLLFFIIFMLASTAFDGFRSTSSWPPLYDAVFQPIANVIGITTANLIALLLAPAFFLVLYLVALGAMKLIMSTKYSLRELAFAFAPSLVPIALAYNFAHYYTLLLVQGQSMFAMLSDPFNQHWNLFGTAGYQINVGIVGASFVWNSQVAAIVIGHVAAVYLAHIVALKLFPNHRKAVISQLPMLLLMVAYTLTGLWILSQPLTLGM